MKKLTKHEKTELKRSLDNLRYLIEAQTHHPSIGASLPTTYEANIAREINYELLLKAIDFIDISAKEMDNLEKIVSLLDAPVGEVPVLEGMDIFGKVIPLYGIGGDHITYASYNQRYVLDKRIEDAKAKGKEDVAAELEQNKHRATIFLMDAEGHLNTDSFSSKLVHQTFLFGLKSDLEQKGSVSLELLERINMRFFESTNINKSVSGLLCTVYDTGKVRFTSMGHPLPVVFSYELNRFVDIKDVTGRDFDISSPLGLKPWRKDFEAEKYADHILGYKDDYQIDEINLAMPGDMFFMFTDGMSDHTSKSGKEYFPRRLEDLFREIKHAPAHEMADLIETDLMKFNRKRKDDISYVIIKKTS